MMIYKEGEKDGVVYTWERFRYLIEKGGRSLSSCKLSPITGSWLAPRDTAGLAERQAPLRASRNSSALSFMKYLRSFFHKVSHCSLIFLRAFDACKR